MAKCFFCNDEDATREVENKAGVRVEACWQHYLLALGMGWDETGRDGVPERLEEMNFSTLIESCVNYIHDLNDSGWVDEDYPHYVFEEAMKCVFGEDIFTWITRKKA
jgi:hypothetical protein